MRIQDKKRILLGFMFAVGATLFATCGYAKCHTSPPVVNVSAEKISPKYYSKPASAVKKLCSESINNPLGCTHYDFTYTFEYTKKSSQNNTCPYIEKIDFGYRLNELYVYIDDAYPKGSCEYNAIKRHEDKHVAVNLEFHKQKVAQYLKNCLADIKRMKLDSSNVYIKRCAENIMENEENIRRRKNADIDASEQYKAKNLGKNW